MTRSCNRIGEIDSGTIYNETEDRRKFDIEGTGSNV
jgi:hypothetical protein